MTGMFHGDRALGMQAIAPLRAMGRCTMTADVTDTYAALNERLPREAAGRHGVQWSPTQSYAALRSGYVVRPVGVDGWTALAEHYKAAPGMVNVVTITPCGGHVSRIPADDCAFVHRAVDMNVGAVSAWTAEDPPDSEERAWSWLNGFLDLLSPYRDGSVYQNFPEPGLADYRTAYWGANLAKLLAVKRIADPCNVFTYPQAVSPDPAHDIVVERLPPLEPEPDTTFGLAPGARDWSELADGALIEPAAGNLRVRVGELSDLSRAGLVLNWDRHVTMPAGGGPARGAMLGTIQRLAHAQLAGAELSMLLAMGDPDDPIVRVVGRDHRRARNVPAQLTDEISRGASEGMAAWLDARAHNDFRRFEAALRRNVELARRYADCFADADHPYDALLDRYEPGATTADVDALLERLCGGLAPLVAGVAARAVAEPPAGPFPVQSQHAVALEIAAAMGFDADCFRLDASVHPFTCASAPTDVRVTARFEDGSLAGLFTFLHELGHALYERGIDPALARTGLDTAVSMGVHESQSLLWENFVGRREPFWSRWLPRLRKAMPAALGHVALDDFVRAVNVVRPTLIRVDADEVTYLLHVLLRFDLEVLLVEGVLDTADVPEAWAQRTRDLLGIDVLDDRRGVLQDLHWAHGMIGYFPTYAIGSVLAAQMWEVLRADLPGLDDELRAGHYGALCDWLGERVHRHGRMLSPSALVEQAVGGPLDPGPLREHLEARCRAAQYVD